MKKLLLILLVLFCVGCTDVQDYITDNNKELASGGTVIGVFPDGTKVRSYDLYVSIQVPSGRVWNRQQLLVIEQKGEKDKAILINGQLYAPAEHE